MAINWGPHYIMPSEVIKSYSKGVRLREYLDWGLVDIFRKHESGGNHYTFWDYRIPNGFKRNLGWRIDYILATKPLADRSQRAWIDTEPRTRKKPSDHTFLVAEFS